MAVTEILPCRGNFKIINKGDCDDTHNFGYRWNGTDNGLWVWSAPTVSNLTKEKPQGHSQFFFLPEGFSSFIHIVGLVLGCHEPVAC